MAADQKKIEKNNISCTCRIVSKTFRFILKVLLTEKIDSFSRNISEVGKRIPPNYIFYIRLYELIDII
jgi:hypothetical protein